MQLVTGPLEGAQAADLTLTFLTPGAAGLPERVTRDLKPGKVALLSRSESGDVAVALTPEDAGQAREVGAAFVKLANDLGARALAVEASEYGDALALAALAAGRKDARYREQARPAPTSLTVQGLADSARLEALTAGVQFARDLVNAPANVLNPATLAREARRLEGHGADVDIWDSTEIEARGMGLLAAVAAGSATGPRLIRVTLPARGEVTRVVALVGKGVTFDTGGYSIKPAAGMAPMKNDMGGAATVLGAMRALAGLRDRLPEGLEVRAYVPAAENMVGPHAMRPGDIYRAANGKTVEVVNTDAEGRLILADALAVACDEGATEIVDVATLTGAKMIALGSDIAGLFASDADLAARLKASAEAAGEYVWELPLHAPYLKAFQKETLADLRNSDLVPQGGSIKAALFLQEFVPRPWAHLDIAGNAQKDGEATGWGVGTLVGYVLNG
ncbi:leucyl aminopeptidase family protein [Deinococcus sp. SDU3-2]|uniref:Leucyl aminopeptidase family protein n=1 Tax=Deinococcus terrestris TaxID=2651870 RepID=A0A7X1TRJ9_9DEIO|nr:leucyl aminopeptidase family protein [Deinococcus terrestris]MPY66868.1 leucyl aminopeptidase family protein [Deinococcus terrestris]